MRKSVVGDDNDDNDDDNDADRESSEETASKANSNDILTINALVYIAADYYQIPGLMELASFLFHKASKNFNMDGFPEIVSLLYSLTSGAADRMRNIICSVIVTNIDSLIHNQAFIDVAVHLPDLMAALLPKLIDNHRTKSIEASETLTATIAELEMARNSLEIERLRAKLAETKADNIRDKVNESTQCRHCKRESNVSFDEDGTLRCVCRCRY